MPRETYFSRRLCIYDGKDTTFSRRGKNFEGKNGSKGGKFYKGREGGGKFYKGSEGEVKGE